MATEIDLTYPILTIKYIVGDYLELQVLMQDPNPIPDPPEGEEMVIRNLTGWSATAQVRATLKADSELIATFTIPTLGADGIIVVQLPETESKKLSALPAAGGYWDLQLRDPDGKPQTILGGPIKPKGDVTR